MKTIRMAVIGCGVIGPVHAECIKQMEGVELAAVCDTIPERAKALAERHGAKRWTVDAAELWNDPGLDAVSIGTDHASHAALAVAALDAGKHVLCEKPLAHSFDGLRRMLAAGERHPELTFCGVFQHRFDPLAIALRELVRSGDLGQLATASARLYCERTPEYYAAAPWRGHWSSEGGSALINQAIHFLDMLLWTAGPAEAVSAEWANRAHEGIIETEDAIVMALRLESGALASFETTNGAHLGWAWRLELCGHDGTVELTDDKVTRVAFRRPAAQEAWADRRAQAEAAKNVPVGKNYYGTGHPAQFADFIKTIREPGAHIPRVPAASAARTARVVLSAYESGRIGARIDLSGKL